LGMSFHVLRALEGRDESIALTMPRMGLKKDRGGDDPRGSVLR